MKKSQNNNLGPECIIIKGDSLAGLSTYLNWQKEDSGKMKCDQLRLRKLNRAQLRQSKKQ